MDLDLIAKLFALLDQSTAEELEVTENGVTIRMSKRAHTLQRGQPVQTVTPAATTATAPAAAVKPGMVDVKAGMTGTFYRAASPDAPAFVEVGSQVRDGDRLALLEAMKTFNPVEAECNGVIAEIVAQDGALVEAGAVLFRIEKV